MRVPDEAWPLAFVVAVMLPVPLLKVAPAPLAGAVNVTVTLGTGLFAASRTNATRALAKAVFTVADCPDPLTTLMEAGTAGVTVKLNELEVTPLSVALMAVLPAWAPVARPAALMEATAV